MHTQIHSCYDDETGYHEDHVECCDDCGAPLVDPDYHCDGECADELEYQRYQRTLRVLATRPTPNALERLGFYADEDLPF